MQPISGLGHRQIITVMECWELCFPPVPLLQIHETAANGRDIRVPSLGGDAIRMQPTANTTLHTTDENQSRKPWPCKQGEISGVWWESHGEATGDFWQLVSRFRRVRKKLCATGACGPLPHHILLCSSPLSGIPWLDLRSFSARTRFLQNITGLWKGWWVKICCGMECCCFLY